MVKTLEDLEKSREIRQTIMSKYGFIPTSVWEIDYSKGKHIIEFDERKQDVIAKQKHESMEYDRRLQGAFSMSSKNVRGTDENSGLSTFPPELCRIIVEFYSKEMDLILDPFAGHNSRMQVCYELNRNYIGYDVSQKFMEFNRKVKDIICNGGNQGLLLKQNNMIELVEQSSEKLNQENQSIDFIFSSPPYWCVEFYGNEQEQLGLSETYEKFLNRMQIILNECFRVLRKDKYCVMNINDFRMDGELYIYHSDIIRIMKNAGFKIWDIIIIKWQNCIGQCFASQIEDRKITAKGHEYLIVGKKITGFYQNEKVENPTNETNQEKFKLENDDINVEDL